MPDLPTVTVTQAQADRILAAFQAKYGTTTIAETATAYRKDLVRYLIRTVQQFEEGAIHEQFAADVEALRSDLESVMPDPDTVT